MVTVTDGDGTTADDSEIFILTVNNVNQTPTANAGADQPVNEGVLVTLDGTASFDPDGTIASYTWIQTAGTGVTLSSAAASKPTFTAPSVGPAGEVLTFSLVVTDNAGAASAADTVDVVVNDVPAKSSVDPISYSTAGGKNSDKHLKVTIKIVNDLSPVSGALVSITLVNTSIAQSWSYSGTTDADGTITFRLNNAPSGTYATTVTGVTSEGLLWDGMTPVNNFTKP